MSRKNVGARNARRRTRAAISAAAVLAAAATIAAPAGAAVGGSHVVAVLPATQGLELSGYPVNDALNVHVIRHGVTIGSATGTTTPDRKDPNNGVLNVAGGAPPCWTGSTPQILPGDEVTVDDGGTGLDSMIVQNVAATSLERDPVTGHVLVHGFAVAPGGGEYDATTFAASVQARITIAATGTPFSNGRNSVRAGVRPIVSSFTPTRNTPSKFLLPSASWASRSLMGKSAVHVVGFGSLTVGGS